MKFYYLIITSFLLFNIQCEKKDYVPTIPDDKPILPIDSTIVDTIVYDIDLSELNNNYLDLNNYKTPIIIGGVWKGDRIVLKNGSNKEITFLNATINSNHAEEALVISGPTHRMRLFAINSTLNCGGLTIWKGITQSLIDGFVIKDGHTGLKHSQEEENYNDTIQNITIQGSSFEGVYWGPYFDGSKRHNNVIFKNINVENSGWDDFQIGDCTKCDVYNLIVKNGARKNENLQNYLVTVNKGGDVRFHNLIMINDHSEKLIQNIESRFFIFK